MANERVPRNTPGNFSVAFAFDETVTDADGAVLVTVTTDDGTELASAATAVHSTPGSGIYQYALAAQETLALLTLEWSGTFNGLPVSVTTYGEIVGGHYFSLGTLRASDAALSNTSKYTTAKLRAVRTAVETAFERICHRAFVPRRQRETMTGDGSATLWLCRPEPLRVTQLVVDGTDVTADWTVTADRYNLRVLNLADGHIWPDAPIAIEYEYGKAVVPSDIARAALKWSKYQLLGDTSRIDERATIMNVPDFGQFVLATPGMRGSYTGIPEVDIVLGDYVLEGGSA